MSQQNLSERKKKLRKNNPNNPNVPKETEETDVQKLSRDARRKQLHKAETVTAQEPDKKKKRFVIPVNALVLKIMLVLLTAIGIAGIVFFDPQTVGRRVLRGVGIAGLPIAVFLMAESYYHTEHRLRYAGRLFVWALLAQLPMMMFVTYDNARNQNLRADFKELTETEQFRFLLEWREAPLLNYLFTLLFALLFLWLADMINRRFRKGARNMPMTLLLGSLLLVLLAMGVALGGIAQSIKLLEAPVFALMIVFACVILREKKEVLALMIGLIGMTVGIISGPKDGQLFYAIGAALPGALIAGYDGKLGYKKEEKPYLKYAFYIAYAVTISVLVMIGMYVYVQQHGGQ